MSEDRRLPLDERVRAKDALYASLLSPRGSGAWLAAIAAAVALHAALALVRLPGATAEVAPSAAPAPRLVRYDLPPPPARPVSSEPVIAEVRRPASDDVTPPAPLEPIAEPLLQTDAGEAPPEPDFLTGDPDPPPARERPAPAATEATPPTLVPESRVEPEYPAMARLRGLGGALLLRVVVLADGRVGDVTVLRSSRPNVGFEAAAASAVRRWRYRPALKDGHPVDAVVFVPVQFRAR